MGREPCFMRFAIAEALWGCYLRKWRGGGKGRLWVAGRPSRRAARIGFDGKEVKRILVRWYLDERVVKGVREISARRRDPARQGIRSVSEAAEGLIYWGIICAIRHRDSDEYPAEITTEEAETAHLTILTKGQVDSPRLGELDSEGRFTPDDYEPRFQGRRAKRRAK